LLLILHHLAIRHNDGFIGYELPVFPNRPPNDRPGEFAYMLLRTIETFCATEKFAHERFFQKHPAKT
jgi:hypothetical protein